MTYEGHSCNPQSLKCIEEEGEEREHSLLSLASPQVEDAPVLEISTDALMCYWTV